MAQLILGKFDILGGGTWVEVAERLLHHMERVTLLDHFGAACVAQLVNGIQQFALGVEQRGCEMRVRVS